MFGSREAAQRTRKCHHSAILYAKKVKFCDSKLNWRKRSKILSAESRKKMKKSITLGRY